MFNLIKQLIAEKINAPSSFEKVKKRSDIRFKKLVRHALTNSVFYKNYYKDNGITLKDVEHLKIEEEIET